MSLQFSHIISLRSPKAAQKSQLKPGEEMIEDGAFILTERAFNTRHYSSLSGLIFLILDHALTFKDEYNHIWRAQIRIDVQLFYLIARYLALSAEIAHYSLLRVFLIRSPIPLNVCQGWFTFLFITLSVLVFILDVVLFLRILALYERNWKIFLLCIPTLLPFAVGAWLFVGNTFSPDSFNLLCDVVKIPVELPFLAAVVIMSHGLLWVATFAKRNIAQGRAVVVRLVVQEGAWAFVLLCAIIAGVMPYSFVSRSSNPSVIFIISLSSLVRPFEATLNTASFI
jgi:hypothetical protein